MRGWLAATDAVPRRRVLAVATMVLPLAATASCSVPDVLAKPPGPALSVRTLSAAIAAEQALVTTYQHVISRHPDLEGRLHPFLTQHQDHLAQLKSRLIVPPHVATPSALPASAAPPAAPASASAAITLLGQAEQNAATAQLGRLGGAPPSLAQLLASIAASEATHAVALSARTAADQAANQAGGG